MGNLIELPDIIGDTDYRSCFVRWAYKKGYRECFKMRPTHRRNYLGNINGATALFITPKNLQQITERLGRHLVRPNAYPAPKLTKAYNILKAKWEECDETA